MPLRTFVKVGNITHLSDARYCAAMGVDMLGFGVDPALPGYLAPDAFRAITDWLSGVLLAGEVRHPDGVALAPYALHYLQAGTLPAPGYAGPPLILRVDWDEVRTAAEFAARMEPARPQVAYFLLESGRDAPLTAAVAAELQAVAKQFPVLLGFGLHRHSVLELLDTVRPAGIALQGAPEIRPGYKHFDDLAEILDLLETD